MREREEQGDVQEGKVPANHPVNLRYVTKQPQARRGGVGRRVGWGAGGGHVTSRNNDIKVHINRQMLGVCVHQNKEVNLNQCDVVFLFFFLFVCAVFACSATAHNYPATLLIFGVKFVDLSIAKYIVQIRLHLLSVHILNTQIQSTPTIGRG